MLIKRIMLAGILFFLLMAVVPVALAQDLQNIELADILDALGPRQGDQLIEDILLYAIFIVGLVAAVLVPDKQMFVQMIMFLVVLCALVAKLLVGRHASAIWDACDIPVLGINVTMFVGPMISAGMLRSVKGKRSSAVVPAIFTGLLGGGYFFLYWLFEQKDAGCTGQAIPTIIDVVSQLPNLTIGLF
jgi:hypothetical protein